MNENISHLIVSSDWVNHKMVDNDVNTTSNHSLLISESMIMVWSLSKFTMGLKVYYLISIGKYLKLEFNYLDPIIRNLPSNILEYDSLGQGLAFMLGLMGKIRSINNGSSVTGLEKLSELVSEFAKTLQSKEGTYSCKLSKFARSPKTIWDQTHVA